ncbi:MAG: TauD/TfdA family dioxygenase [Pirellulaceae bacterium]|nr:TauD/TfdA family dioxygenase [Pirellulaceae bacterium]
MNTIPSKPHPIESAANWQGTELLQHPDWEARLSTDELTQIDQALRGVANSPLSEINAATFQLGSLGDRLVAIQGNLEHGSGVLLLKSISVDRYSPAELQRLFLGLLSHLGTPVSQSAEGTTVFSVRNEGLGTQDPKTRGPNTNKKLSFHTDRCDVIGFLCIQPAMTGGENQIVSSVAVYNKILSTRPDLLSILLQPFYYQRHNVDLGNETPFTKQPIFSIYQGHFAANFLRVLIERAYADESTPEMTPQQREALDFLETTAADPSLSITFRQEVGDLLLLNNFVTLHRRTEFKDNVDHPRHLLRIWLSMPNSRPLDPMFAGNYGSVKAGAIRGGMRPQHAP